MTRLTIGTGLVLAALITGGCIGAGPVKLSADTYRLSRADPGGVFADAAAMKASVVSEANAFAQSNGKVDVPVAVREETTRVGHLATIDYDFRLVSPGEPTPKPAEATPQPDVASDHRKPTAVDTPATGRADAKPDLYTELIKLDELRKRGILTEAEFQALKAKLIAAQ